MQQISTASRAAKPKLTITFGPSVAQTVKFLFFFLTIF